jgi:hypothetical protein
MVSIPASSIVNVVPNVVSADGTGLNLGGLVLTNSTRVPIGTVATFTNAPAVSAFFGPSSTEAAFALRYFAGFDGSSIKPAQLNFYQYAGAGAAGYLQGGNVASLTLAQLQAIAGPITLSINGTPVTSGALNLSAAASFSAAAALIQAAIATNDAVVTGSIAGTTLTVTAVASGTLGVGQAITGASVLPGTTITALLTGTGGAGTYTVSAPQTVASTSITAGATSVVYDAVSGSFLITAGTPSATSSVGAATAGAAATALKLTTAAGAITSAGSGPMTSGGAMAGVVASTQNFATFTTLFATSIPDKVAFATWTSAQNGRFLYAMGDNDINATVQGNTTNAAYQIIAAKLGGVMPIYNPLADFSLTAFAMGAIACVDFTAAGGRTNLAFRQQAGLTPSVTNQQVGDILTANGYNFYGSYATAAQAFQFFYPGSVTGPFIWADSLINEVWMTNNFQLALMTLLTAIPSIPYNIQGYALIEEALSGPINAAVRFGAIRAGINLTPLQVAQINNAAGMIISDTLTMRGWYLQVSPASGAQRAARSSPPINFWYTDGQSVQKIALNSIEVQ